MLALSRDGLGLVGAKLAAAIYPDPFRKLQ